MILPRPALQRPRRSAGADAARALTRLSDFGAGVGPRRHLLRRYSVWRGRADMRGTVLLVGMLGLGPRGPRGTERSRPQAGSNWPRTSQDPGARGGREDADGATVDRPLTLPGGHLAMGSSFGWLHADLPASTFLERPPPSRRARRLALTGITDGLELDLLLPGLALAIQPARPAQGVDPARACAPSSAPITSSLA